MDNELKRKEELRFKHTLMEYEDDIKHCKEVLASGVTGDNLKYTLLRLKRSERERDKMLKSRKSITK